MERNRKHSIWYCQWQSMFVCVWVYVWACICVYMCPQRPEEEIKSPEIGVIGGCETSNVSTVKGTQILCKRSTLNHWKCLSSPFVCLLVLLTYREYLSEAEFCWSGTAKWSGILPPLPGAIATSVCYHAQVLHGYCISELSFSTITLSI